MQIDAQSAKWAEFKKRDIKIIFLKKVRMKTGTLLYFLIHQMNACYCYGCKIYPLGTVIVFSFLKNLLVSL